MKRCPEPADWVLYATGELPSARARAAEAHLASCAACRRNAAKLAHGLKALQCLEGEPAVRPEALEALRRRLRAAEAHVRKPLSIFSFARHYRWVAAAAVVVAAAVVWSSLGPPPETTWDPDALTEIAAAVELLEVADLGTNGPLPQEAIEAIESLMDDDPGPILEYLLSEEDFHG